jgi:hypothetical protein
MQNNYNYFFKKNNHLFFKYFNFFNFNFSNNFVYSKILKFLILKKKTLKFIEDSHYSSLLTRIIESNFGVASGVFINRALFSQFSLEELIKFDILKRRFQTADKYFVGSFNLRYIQHSPLYVFNPRGNRDFY